MIQLIGWMISAVSFGYFIGIAMLLLDYFINRDCVGIKFLLGFVALFLALWVGTFYCGVYLINWSG